jgi:outer membrane protein assembly factor BamB
MKKKSTTGYLLAVVTALQLALVTDAGANALDNWPQWRGPLVNGFAPNADPPTEWSERKNMKWKVKLPGSGTATPVVWGDRIFILTAVEKKAEVQSAASTAVPNGDNTPGGQPRSSGGFGSSDKPTENYQFKVLCLDRQSGRILWERVAVEAVPHEGHHKDHGYASASPVTDGNVLLAYFGSRGLHCYDLDGNLKWSRQFGQMHTRNGFGEGASPALHGNTVVVNWDDETDNDFIIALDKRNGKELWRTPRREATGWSTPVVIERDQLVEVVVNAPTVHSYDLATGRELWSCGGMTQNAIPSLVHDADTLYAISGFRGSSLQAIQLGHTGDLTGSGAIRWSHNKSTPYVPSPLLVRNRIYFLSGNTGRLSCFDTTEGKPLFEARQLEGIFGVYASPVAAKDRVYVLGREGKCTVLKAGGQVEVIATNKLDDRTDASIALAGSDLLIRGHEHLYCIAER